MELDPRERFTVTADDFAVTGRLPGGAARLAGRDLPPR
jgi:hypothetical protein